jgi:OsmC-like protein
VALLRLTCKPTLICRGQFHEPEESFSPRRGASSSSRGRIIAQIHLAITSEQRDQHPQVFTRIHLEYVVRGDDFRPEDVVRAIELSEGKYCSVSAMLRPAVPITWSYRVDPCRVARPAA